MAVKVVRELGQPALAAAFADHDAGRDRGKRAAPAVLTDVPSAAGRRAGEEVVLRFAAGAPLTEVLPACVRAYTLQTVFARDLVAAQSDGLLTLAGLETPCELAGLVAQPTEAGVLAAVEQARRFAGDFVVLDGPEQWLACSGRANAGEVRGFVRELATGLRLTGLRGVVNLNGVAPPPWAGDLAEGPLFAGQRLPPAAELLARLADELARELLSIKDLVNKVRIDWHLSEARLSGRGRRPPGGNGVAGAGRCGDPVRVRPPASGRAAGGGRGPTAPRGPADGGPPPATAGGTARRGRRPGALPQKAGQPGPPRPQRRRAETRVPAAAGARAADVRRPRRR